MQSLSSALNTAYGLAVQRPAWFVEITLQGSTEFRSTFATVSWNATTWTVADIDLSDVQVGPLEVSGSLELGNADDYWGAIALGEGFQDKRVRIWGYDGSMGAPGVSDPFLLCDAAGGRAEVRTDRVRVALRDGCAYKYGPRARVNYAYGFHQLLPAGKRIVISGQAYAIERR